MYTSPTNTRTPDGENPAIRESEVPDVESEIRAFPGHDYDLQGDLSRGPTHAMFEVDKEDAPPYHLVAEIQTDNSISNSAPDETELEDIIGSTRADSMAEMVRVYPQTLVTRFCESPSPADHAGGPSSASSRPPPHPRFPIDRPPLVRARAFPPIARPGRLGIRDLPKPHRLGNLAIRDTVAPRLGPHLAVYLPPIPDGAAHSAITSMAYQNSRAGPEKHRPRANRNLRLVHISDQRVKTQSEGFSLIQ